MPTENERKFVLDIASYVEKDFLKHSDSIRHIRQGYLFFSKGASLRVRETIEEEKSGVKHEICIKQRAGSRVIEIEKKLDNRDFHDLWDISLNRLEKIRYNCVWKGQLWEVDFFKNHEQQNYFAMAEHEMPEGQISPDFIPARIKEHLIFEVPLDDDRFSSKRIACVNHAKKLYESLIRERPAYEAC